MAVPDSVSTGTVDDAAQDPSADRVGAVIWSADPYPTISLCCADGCWIHAPPTFIRGLLNRAASASADARLAVAAAQLRAARGIDDLPLATPLLVEVACTLHPWLADVYRDGRRLPPTAHTHTPLQPVLGASTLREAAGRLTGRNPSRLVMRALGRIVTEDRPLPVLDLWPLALAELAGALGLADEQVATVLTDAASSASSRDGLGELSDSQRTIMIDALSGSDPAVVCRLLCDLGNRRPAALLPRVLNDLDTLDNLRVPARADLERWSRDIADAYVARRGPRGLRPTEGRHLLPTSTSAGRLVTAPMTVAELAALAGQFDNCLDQHIGAYTRRRATTSLDPPLGRRSPSRSPPGPTVDGTATRQAPPRTSTPAPARHADPPAAARTQGSTDGRY